MPLDILKQVDDRIRRAVMLIEQHRLHILSMHPSRRQSDEKKLRSLMDDFVWLLKYRRALVAEPPYTLLH